MKRLIWQWMGLVAVIMLIGTGCSTSRSAATKASQEPGFALAATAGSTLAPEAGWTVRPVSDRP